MGAQSSFLILLISNSARFSWIPGSESTNLDLEKLALLSDAMEKLNLNGTIEIAEPYRKRPKSGRRKKTKTKLKKLLGPLLGTK